MFACKLVNMEHHETPCSREFANGRLASMTALMLMRLPDKKAAKDWVWNRKLTHTF